MIDVNVFVTVSSLVAILLTIVNLFNSTIGKPRETQDIHLKNTERLLNEFIITYSGEYSELKTSLDYVKNEVAELKKESKAQNSVIDELARDILRQEYKHTSNRERGEVK